MQRRAPQRQWPSSERPSAPAASARLSVPAASARPSVPAASARPSVPASERLSAPASERWAWPNVPKSEWGPRGWDWIHAEAIDYPEAPTQADAREAFRRVWAFVTGLPCAECRWHAAWHVVRSPPDLAGTEAYQAWAWRFHNAVNARLGKPLFSYEDYLAFYDDEICRAGWRADR